jgi:phosphatidylserine/phosphatidylglycerophosphate/cardiolipin synthase-like enzyme
MRTIMIAAPPRTAHPLVSLVSLAPQSHRPAARGVGPCLPLLAAALLGAGCRSSSVYFSEQDDLTAVMTDEMGAAGQTLDVAVYTFTSEPIRDALIDAAARGVAVRAVIDTWEANDAVVSSLQGTDVQVRRKAGFAGGIMHNKFAVIDGQSVLTGSFNWTYAADEQNDENLLLLSDKALAGQYGDEFDRLWAAAE